MTVATDQNPHPSNAIVEWVSPVTEFETGFIGEAGLDMYRFFPYAIDTEKLCAAFATTGREFKEFSSILLRSEGEGFRVGYISDLLQVEVRALDEDYVWDPSVGFHRYVVPVKTMPGQPLYKVAATRLRNGTVVAESLSHVVADGFSRYVFLQHITAMMCGRPVAEQFKDIRSGRYQRANIVAESYDEVGRLQGSHSSLKAIPNRGRRRSFFYSLRLNRQWIDDMRARHAVSDRLTSSDILTGYLLRTFGLEMCSSAASGFRARIPVDMRSVIGGTDHTLGNAFLDAIIPGTPESWGRISLEDAAAAVHDGVLVARSHILRECRDHQPGQPFKEQAWFMRLWHEMAGEHPFVHESDIVISNMRKLPYDMIDYGGGAAVDMFSANSASNSFVIFTLGSDIVVAIASQSPLVVTGQIDIAPS